jgi:hypothetical protein
MSIRRYISLVENANRHPLEWFGDESNYNIKSQRAWAEGGEDEEGTENGPSLFPSGGQWFICTDWADYVRRAYGKRAKLFGFSCEDNPAPGLEYFDGHDFALVDDRYIVDGWLPNVEGLHHSAVIDLKDPKEKEIVAKFYGNPKLWDRNIGREKQIDKETPEQRAKAMRGVGSFPEF